MDRPDVRQISKRKVLYVSLDEEITSIFERIARLNYEEVYLVVPERSVLLQTVVNLQILKKKADSIHKKLSLITHDPVGIKLAHKAEIPVYDQLEAPESTQEEEDEEPVEFSSSPIAAVSNDVDDERPERLRHKKLSIFDIVRNSKQRGLFSMAGMKRLWNARKDKKLLKESSRFIAGAPSRKALGTLVIASLCILFLISYIALPGATVTVTPQFNVIEQSVNITLANTTVYGTNPLIDGASNVLPYYPVTVTIKKTLNYTSTGQIFDGTSSSGTITVINERSTPWPLVAFTRLQTEGGLIFRTQEAVTVPAATNAGFGSIEVFVVADDVDAYNRVIGERGNIEPSAFFLPGLREDSQKELYARSDTPMTGGSTVVTLQISEEDIEAAGVLMQNTLEGAVEDALGAEVDQRNQTNNTNLVLLTGYNAIELGEPEIETPSNLIGAIQDQFQVSGEITVSGMAVGKDDFVALLKQSLNSRKSPDKILIKINEDSIAYEIFEVDETPGQVKLTATIKGIEAYDFDAESENGAKLIKKIKEHIAGKAIKDAEDYIQNLPEINKVKISSWPVWAPTIPTVFENIEIEVDEKWLSSFDEEQG